MSEVQCMTCRHFTLRESPLARNGFGRCLWGRVAQFVSATFPRKCSAHSPMDGESIAKRQEWLGGKK